TADPGSEVRDGAPERRAPGSGGRVGAVLLLALIPAAVTIPALAALALVSGVCSRIVAYEAIPIVRAECGSATPTWQPEREPHYRTRQGGGRSRPQNLFPELAARVACVSDRYCVASRNAL